MKRNLCFHSGLFVDRTFFCCHSFVANADQPSNNQTFLLILVDDLKPSFGAYGEKWVHSPNLDRIASSGIRFDMAYCNQAVALHRETTCWSVRDQRPLGVYGLGYHFRRAVPDAITMPQYFKQHGYHAAGVGKVLSYRHGNVNDIHSWSVPFQPDKVIDYVLPASTDGKLTKEEALFGNRPARGLTRGAAWEKADVDDGAYADGRIAAEGIKRLRNFKETRQPFFWHSVSPSRISPFVHLQNIGIFIMLRNCRLLRFAFIQLVHQNMPPRESWVS